MIVIQLSKNRRHMGPTVRRFFRQTDEDRIGQNTPLIEGAGGNREWFSSVSVSPLLLAIADPELNQDRGDQYSIADHRITECAPAA